MILLNPGPANTTETVKQAQVVPDICPREREFGELMAGVSRRLAAVVGDPDVYTAVLFGGSGTAAVEAALASTVPADGRLLVVDNGAYGARMQQIAAAYGMRHEVVRSEWGDLPDLDAIATALAGGGFTQLCVVHHETTTGMLNPVAAIGALCQQHGVTMIVDAMSSYAGLPCDMQALGADYLISSSNKCVQGMAGLGFVIGRMDAIEALPDIAGRSLYLDLKAQHRFFVKQGQMRFTPPVQVCYALAQALSELEAEGKEARYHRYLSCWEALDGGVRELGFTRLLDDETQLSKILTAYVEPDNPAYSYDALHDALHAKGFTIYPGKGAKEATFRLANMGAITPQDMRRFVTAMGQTIDELRLRPLYAEK
ncbi:MAG: 2-aminoethylphosphonate--pyruvate transaminase [Myxococcales bacterium]|nr:2-aminoethylphosphonate--pyruvate transaminase [Myxococcales bacterium]